MMYFVTASVGRTELGLVGKFKCHLGIVEKHITDWLADFPDGKCIVYEADEELISSSPIAIWSRQ